MPSQGAPPTDELHKLRQRIAELESKLSEFCRAEQSAAESRARFRALFEACLDAVITVDREGRITSANQAAAAVSGYSVAELVGQRISQLCAPDCLTRSLKAFNQALLGAPRLTPTKFRTKEGRLVAALANGAPLLQGGETVGLFIVLCRMAGRLHGQEHPRFSEAEWQATFDAVSDGICLVSPAGRILRANQALAQIAGCPNEQLLGRSFTEVIPEFAAPDPHGPLQRIRHSRRPETVEAQRNNHWYQLECVPILNPEQELAGAVLRLIDTTARRATEDQLRRLQQQLEPAN